MTKIQLENRKRMEYVPQLRPQFCKFCSAYAVDIVVYSNFLGKDYTREKNPRCTKGGFPVKRHGSCNEWSGKASQ